MISSQFISVYYVPAFQIRSSYMTVFVSNFLSVGPLCGIQYNSLQEVIQLFCGMRSAEQADEVPKHIQRRRMLQTCQTLIAYRFRY